ncbi:hypothetical protein [Flavobacterium sp. LAR06]|uniref:hypothetical protein n=1 Tax=Flavobacterium sp. LAR06 TaxID=3064897 RepID=UPI0035BF4F87
MSAKVTILPLVSNAFLYAKIRSLLFCLFKPPTVLVINVSVWLIKNIRSHLRRPLAKKIISGEVKDGDKMVVRIENDIIKWIKEEVLVEP